MNMLIILVTCLVMLGGMKFVGKSEILQHLRGLEDQVGRLPSSLNKTSICDRYRQWCQSEGKEEAFTYDLINGFIIMFVLANGGSSKSIDGIKSAIKQRCEVLRLHWLDAVDDRRLSRMVSTMKYNDLVQVKRMSPLTLKLLNVWTEEYNLSEYRVLMFVTLLYLRHDGLLRIGELLGGLKLSDILWEENRRGFSVWLSRSKANRTGDGERVIIRDHKGRSAVKMMSLWFERRGSEPGQNTSLFPGLKGDEGLCKTVSSSWVRGQIKNMAAKNGRQAENFSGHSLRAGGATDLYIARVPYYLIKKMRHWKSDAAMIYYRSDDDVCYAVSKAFSFLSGVQV